MLGRHHLLLSLFTATVLLVPYLQEYTYFVLFALFGVIIGSLIPDADSTDAAIFHERIGIKGDIGKIVNNLFSPLFPIFGHVTKYAIYKPAVFILGNTFLKKYNITQEHRGFLHSFVGIITSMVFTAIYLLIILLVLGVLNVWYLVVFLTAYLLGALMHLLEDSATVTGIQFNYPFSDLRLKGKLVTNPEHPSMKIPDAFAGFLLILTGALFFAIELQYITLAKWQITLFSFLVLLACWAIFLFLLAGVRFTREKPHFYKGMKSYF